MRPAPRATPTAEKFGWTARRHTARTRSTSPTPPPVTGCSAWIWTAAAARSPPIWSSCALLDRAGLPHLFCASGPFGGRHVWIGLAEAVPAPQVARLADALAARLPSLDTAPLRNPATGCLRPPGAPHRITGAARTLPGDPAVLIAPRVGRIQLRRLLDLLGPAPAGGARPRIRRGGGG